ncbi:MAG: hypothetical protein HYY03_01915 [Chloroflexi bacterium]|nr:hypothetical protein [Chloroflexota bacterium]
MVLPALTRGGYSYETQKNIGTRLGGRRHIVDVVAEDAGGGQYLVSLKWQQVGGTAEQKVPFEVICLADAILNSKGHFDKAYLVLGGGGWSLRDFFVGGGLSSHLAHSDVVRIMTLEDFVAKANKGEL